MTLWEFAAAVDGYVAANGGQEKQPAPKMSEKRLAELGIVGFEEA